MSVRYLPRIVTVGRNYQVAIFTKEGPSLVRSIELISSYPAMDNYKEVRRHHRCLLAIRPIKKVAFKTDHAYALSMGLAGVTSTQRV